MEQRWRPAAAWPPPRPADRRVGLMDHVHLGVDLGTSSVKALVTDEQARPLGSARATYPVLTPRPGRAEGDPADWWTATRRVVRDAVGAAGRSPTAIGLSGQMHGVVVVDARGTPIRPALLWPDTRAREIIDAYLALDPAAAERLANPLSPGMAGPLLRWLAVHEPDTDRATRWVLQPKDWLRFRLTGAIHAEPSDASATLLYDVIGDRWDDEVIGDLGLDPRRFPPLVPSTSLAGHLTAPAAEELGLAAGIPVAAGAADTAAAALGTGLLRPGAVQLTVGTGGQLVTPQDEPVPRPEAGTHLYRSALPRGWYAMAATLNAGLALDWVRALFALDWAEVYAVTSTPIQPEDPLFCPHLVGERTPYLDPLLRGGWLELALDHDREAMLRSALEGVAFALRDALDALPVDDARPPLRIAGGGSEHAGWRQLLADVLERPLGSMAVPDASARGAALVSALACDDLTAADVAGPLAPAVTPVAEPRPSVAALHRDRFERYRAQVRHARTRTPPPA
jgi:xylulokinase